MSRSSRSRTECAYSARFNRWNGRRPGLGWIAAAASTFASSEVANCDSTASSGRRMPGGGIMPRRSLWMIFSATSAFCSACAASKVTSDSPPALPFSLWQPMQYCLVRSG